MKNLRYSLSFALRWIEHYLFPKLNFPKSFSPSPIHYDHFKKSGKELKIVFFGDYMATKDNLPPKFSEDLIKVFNEADYLVGNLEGPITSVDGKAKHLFKFEMSLKILTEFLKLTNKKPQQVFLNLANNHMADQGESGFDKTVEILRKNNFNFFGHDQNILAFKHLDKTIGFFGFTRWLNFTLPENKLNRYYNLKTMDIKNQKKEKQIDFLIATPHWDYEFMHYPSEETKKLKRELLEENVDLIMGHHPHVLQPCTFKNNKLCFYSLGNLTGPHFKIISKPMRLGALVEVRINLQDNQVDASLKTQGYTLHPTVQDISFPRLSVSSLDQYKKKDKKYFQNRLQKIFYETK